MNEKNLPYKLLSLFFVTLLTFGVVACSKRYHNLPAFSAIPIYDAYNHSVGRFKTSYLADQIHAYYRARTNGTLGIATFVDNENLYGSSTFGRLMSEQLMSELVMRGYNVVELRRADALQIMFGKGEFGLSREINTLKGWQDLSGLVVGTYVESPDRVYVNARIIDPSNSVVVSAGSIEMSKTKELAKLLRQNMLASSLERIPVKHLGYTGHPVPYYWPNQVQVPPYYQRKPSFFNEENFYPQERLDNGTARLPLPKDSIPTLPPQPKLEPTT